MKTVVSNDMVAHLWANQSQERARNGKDSVSFEGKHYYSYRIMVARFTDATLNGKRVVLINDNLWWSHTTRRHISNAILALYGHDNIHRMRVWRVCGGNRYDPMCEGGPSGVPHASNVNRMFEEYQATVERLCKPHVYYYGHGEEDLDARLRGIYKAASAYREYCMAFNVDEPHPNFEYWKYKATQAFKRYYDPKRCDVRDKARASRHIRQARAMSWFYAWQEGIAPRSAIATSNLSGRDKHHVLSAFRAADYKAPSFERVSAKDWIEGQGPCSFYSSRGDDWPSHPMIRRKGNELQTSHGAVVPWQDALRSFKIAQHCRALGRGLNGDAPITDQARYVGAFRIDKITDTGDIRAGCHLIPWDESLRLAIREAQEHVRPRYPVPALFPGHVYADVIQGKLPMDIPTRAHLLAERQRGQKCGDVHCDYCGDPGPWECTS